MRLVDANIMMKKVNAHAIAHPTCDLLTGYASSLIAEAPTVDAVPVVHGHWERTKDGAAYCSACKRKMNGYLYGYAHCALCGAIMDEKGETK